MQKNIQTLVNRGEKIDTVMKKSEELSEKSKDYYKNAKQVRRQHTEASVRQFLLPLFLFALLMTLFLVASGRQTAP